MVTHAETDRRGRTDGQDEVNRRLSPFMPRNLNDSFAIIVLASAHIQQRENR
jgi:hypothetical protein